MNGTLKIKKRLLRTQNPEEIITHESHGFTLDVKWKLRSLRDVQKYVKRFLKCSEISARYSSQENNQTLRSSN
jgi:hypothetical protein